MAQYDVQIKVPVLSLSISGEYSSFKKPTGLEYMLLTAIGSPALSRLKWKTFLEKMSIPERMMPLIADVFYNLYHSGMIDTGDFDPNSVINFVRFTTTGMDLFKKGRIKQDPKTFSDTIYYLPYKSPDQDNYAFEVKLSEDDGFDQKRFADISIDMEDLMKYLSDHKSHIGAERDDEILMIEQDFPPEVLCSNIGIKLEFDDTTGNLRFSTGNDANFIKAYFSAPDLLSKIPTLDKNPVNIEILQNGDIPTNWDSYMYNLPGEYKIRGRMVIYDPDYCKTNSGYPLKMDEFSFVDVISEKVARGYVCTKKDVGVYGLDGSRTQKMLVSRSISRDELIGLIEDLSDVIDYNDVEKSLEFIINVGPLAGDEFFKTMIRRYLTKTQNLTDALVTIEKTNKKWPTEMDRIIEETICDRDLSLTEVVSILKESKIELDCELLCKRYRVDDSKENLEIAKKLFQICRYPGVVTSALGVKDNLIESIINGERMLSESKVMAAVNMLTISFKELKIRFNVSDPNDFDISEFDFNQSDAIQKSYTSAAQSLTELKPVLSGCDMYKTLTNYMDLFQNLVELFTKPVPLERLNGYQFGIGIRRKLDIMLAAKLGKKHTLNEMINEALEKELITKEEHDLLHRIKNYGNESAHTKNVQALESTEKKKWVDAVSKIESRFETKE